MNPSAVPATRLVIVGDVVLDRDIIGRVEHLSAEAPVPYVNVMEKQLRPGGAGLAALHAARAGHSVTLITALASDEHGRDLRRMLESSDISIVDFEDPGPTAVMSRVRTADRTLIMLEESSPPVALPREAIDRAWRALSEAQAIVVSDYGRGMTCATGIRDALSEAAARTPMVWDPHPGSDPPVPRVSVATPNVREALQFVPGIPQKSLSGDIARARKLLKSWGARQVALTRGEAGAVLVQDCATAPLVIPARKILAADTSGAGDHFDIIVACHLAAGALPSEAVAAAVAATADHLAAGGVTTLTDPVPPSESVEEFVRRIREAGGSVVATGGCFDLLHAGHVDMLRQARELGDCLVVCLNSDVSTRGLKGPSRPIVPEEDRAAMLKALSSVDCVIIFDEDSPATVLDRLRPDIFVKGGDYARGSIREQDLIESWGGLVVLVPYLSGRSTTELIDHVAQQGDVR